MGHCHPYRADQYGFLPPETQEHPLRPGHAEDFTANEGNSKPLQTVEIQRPAATAHEPGDHGTLQEARSQSSRRVSADGSAVADHLWLLRGVGVQHRHAPCSLDLVDQGSLGARSSIYSAFAGHRPLVYHAEDDAHADCRPGATADDDDCPPGGGFHFLCACGRCDTLLFRVQRRSDHPAGDRQPYCSAAKSGAGNASDGEDTECTRNPETRDGEELKKALFAMNGVYWCGPIIRINDHGNPNQAIWNGIATRGRRG